MNKLHFELTPEQSNIVLTGLAKLSIETALETFHEVRSQAEQQIAQHNAAQNVPSPPKEHLTNP